MTGSVLPYRKVVSTDVSQLEPHPRFYKRFMKVEFDAYALQGRNHGKVLAATSVMVGRICPPWLR